MKHYRFLLLSVLSLFLLTSCDLGLPASTIEGIPGEIYSSLIIVIIGVILFFIIFLKAKKADPLKRPKGILLVAEMAVEKMEGLVVETMGRRYRNFTGYIMAVSFYIFMCFTIGLIGLPSPMTLYIVPFTIALCTFVLIHANSVRFTKWKYFKRYIDPFPLFLPINLLSMWAPLLSLSFRLFGNAVAGWVLMEVIYTALKELSNAFFGLPFFVAPFITPALHAYFDIFSGFIQTLVFIMVSMLLIAQEGPEEDETELEEIQREKAREEKIAQRKARRAERKKKIV